MNQIKLVFSTKSYETAAKEYLKEHILHGEHTLHGDSGFDHSKSLTTLLSKQL